MKKTALFFGSFNPVHIGHLALANYVCECTFVDELWFVVSPHNPFKQQADLLDDDFRLRMVREAVRGYAKIKVCDVEFGLPRPSYTIHTLDALKKRYPRREFYLLMGADNWPAFPKWYQADRLLAENRILVYPRPGYAIDAATLPSNVQYLSTPQFEISSTFIREAVRAGRDVRYFLPSAICKEVCRRLRRPS